MYEASASERNTANVHKRRAATSLPRANVCGWAPSTAGWRVLGGGARNELAERRGAKTGSDRTLPLAVGSPTASLATARERPGEDVKRLRNAITYVDLH
jgi:hypothetical protein